MNCNIPESGKKRVVIIGGGFAGLKLINTLKHSDYQVVLVDENNYHQFPPLLYQVATAGLESNSISFPFRKMFQSQNNFYFRLANVKALDFPNNRIDTSIGQISYDYLVIAAGTTTNFYGNEEMSQKAFPMKSSIEALAIRNMLISNFEKATIATDINERQSYLNVVVAGGGPTGVELAGALVEMKKYVLPKDYPELHSSQMNVYLIEGEARLLGPMSKEASSNAQKSLEKMGVNIILNKKVESYDGEYVLLSDKSRINTKNVLWVSGVTSVTFDEVDKSLLGHANRFNVNEFNQVKGFENVFAVGDICLMMTEKDFPKGHPQLAQVAIQQGHRVGENLLNLLERKPMEPFHYKDLGSLATIGRNKAVADLHKIKLHGFPAWVVWLFVHLRSILGVKNKLMILIEWIWSYMTYDNSERFIVYVPNREKQHKAEELPAIIQDEHTELQSVTKGKPEDARVPISFL